MSSVSRSAHVDAPPAAVWGVLADFAHIADWAIGVDHSCLLSEQTGGVGTVRRVQAGPVTLVEEVTVWEPGERLAYTITGLPPMAGTVANAWKLVAAGSGTHVTLTSTVDAGALPHQRVIARAVGRKMAQAADGLVGGLAAALSRQEQS